MAEDGHNPIIGVGFAYSDSVNAVAPDYPRLSFGVVDGFDPTPDDEQRQRRLPRLRRERGLLPRRCRRRAEDRVRPRRLRRRRPQRPDQEVRGRLHRRASKAVNPDIKVDVTYIEESDLRASTTRPAARLPRPRCTTGGADVVYHAAGGSGSGVFDAAVEAGDGMWAIGVDSDQYLTASDEQKPHILTSMLKRVDVATFDMIPSVADGDAADELPGLRPGRRRCRLRHVGWLHRRHHRPDRRVRRPDQERRDRGSGRALTYTGARRSQRQGPGPRGSAAGPGLGPRGSVGRGRTSATRTTTCNERESHDGRPATQPAPAT